MNITRGQHYVWAYYLKAWASNDRIWCRREGKIFNPNVGSIGKQRDFYKIRQMSHDDVAWLRAFCDQQSPAVRTYGHTIVNDFKEIFEIAQRLKNAGADPNEVDHRIDQLTIDLEEKYVQGVMEQEGKMYLDALHVGDITFYTKPSRRLVFLQFLCTQYVRTKRMRENATVGPSRITSRNPENVWGPLCHIVAATVSANLVRDNYDLYLLRNRTGINLITADQPVINLHAEDTDSNGLVKNFELYYPISSTLATLVSLISPDNSDMEKEDVAQYNSHMVNQSHEQIFAYSRQDLEMLSTVTFESNS